MEQERVTRSLVLCVWFVYVWFVNRCCPFVLFIWPLGCLFFDLRILITALVSSNAYKDFKDF